MTFFILQVLPYIAVMIFIVGMVWRLCRWLKTRNVHNVVLTPAPKTSCGVAVRYVKEIFLFRSLFNGDKSLWAGAWIMHVTLAGIIGGHIVGFAFLGQQFIYMGVSADTSVFLSKLLGTTFGVILAVALLYLLYRRLSINEAKLTSYFADYMHLILLLGIVSAGNFMRLVPGYSVGFEVPKIYMIQLATFQPVTIDPLMNTAFIIHLLLVQILLIIFPFSKLVHLVGIFVNRLTVDRSYVEPAPGMPVANAGVSVGNAASSGKKTT
ncbi:respiratory nitrate reductase subunit gamma [Peptococcaceae bacterium]|nr:respiratory nitrate reductase subunit gamma [Peptococcaceae bacterium]